MQLTDLKKRLQKVPSRAIRYGVIALFVLLVASAASAYYFYDRYVTLRNERSESAKTDQDEVAELLGTISELIVLPEGETPTVATVSDPEKLRDQAFFAKAEKGDRVLIYANARKAVLYSPAKHKIIEVAPINIGAPAPSPFPEE